ncbi:unnamed protein product [Effrenium voratum]|nr:unnamed protein product [Effrenium voratum]
MNGMRGLLLLAVLGTSAAWSDAWSWSELEAPGAPSKRQGHAAVEVGRKIYIIGGCLQEIRCFNDVHVFDTGTRQWSEESFAGPAPVPRGGHTATLVGSDIFVIGGANSEATFSDVHRLDLLRRTWTRLTNSRSSANQRACRDTKRRLMRDGWQVDESALGKLTREQMGHMIVSFKKQLVLLAGEIKGLKSENEELKKRIKPEGDVSQEEQAQLLAAADGAPLPEEEVWPEEDGWQGWGGAWGGSSQGDPWSKAYSNWDAWDEDDAWSHAWCHEGEQASGEMAMLEDFRESQDPPEWNYEPWNEDAPWPLDSQMMEMKECEEEKTDKVDNEKIKKPAVETEDPDQIPEWAVDELELELVGEAPKAAFSSLYALDS